MATSLIPPFIPLLYRYKEAAVLLLTRPDIVGIVTHALVQTLIKILVNNKYTEIKCI